MGNVLRRPALALATAALVCGFAAPVASANPGDLVGSVDAPVAEALSPSVSIAFDGRILYYTNPGEAVLHRITPQGVPLPPTPIIGLPPGGFTGIAALAYDVTRDMFWGVDDITGRDVYLIDKLGNAVFQFTITDDQLMKPGPECGTGLCNQKVDGLAYDAQGDTLWYSPDASQIVYHFDTTGAVVLGQPLPVAVYLGSYDVSSMAPDCEPFSSGIAVGDHGAPTLQGSPTAVMYDFAGLCNSWFKYLGDNFDNPVKQAVYRTYQVPPSNGTRAEDDECDNVTFKVPVVWVRDEEDNIFRAFEVPTCFLGGGTPIQDKDRMTGGGGLPIIYGGNPGDSAHHGFMIHCNSFVDPDRLEVNWPGHRFHMTSIVSSTCGNDSTTPNTIGTWFNMIKGVGCGRLNGVPGAQVEWSFTDAGEPGTSDHGDLWVKQPQIPNVCPDATATPVMHAYGYLTKLGPLVGEGNYQAHQGA